MERKVNRKRKFNEVNRDEEMKNEDSINDKSTSVSHKKRKLQNDKEEEEKGVSSNNKMQRIILWFRNDLRLHDNPLLNHAVTFKAANKEIVPVYSFDPRFFTRRVDKYDMRKCGLIRTRFILESVLNFRQRLEKVGSKLLVTMEKPEDFLPSLLGDDCDNHVVYQQEVCSEELAVEKAVKEACKKAQIHSLWGSTVYHM